MRKIGLFSASVAAWAGLSTATIAQPVLTPKQAEAIFRTLRPEIDRRDPAALNDAGVAYEVSARAELDLTKAAAMYRRAAAAGSAAGQYNLSRLLSAGRGVEKDQVAAVALLKTAAAAGYGPAQHRLADLYAAGQGVTKNMDEAVRLFRLVADKGGMQAQYYLGLAYAGGIGAPKDLVEAYKWLTIAASGPASEARPAILDTRKDVAAKMTAAQIAEGEQRAKAWTPKSLEDSLMNSDYLAPGSPTRPYESRSLQPSGR